MVTGRFGTKGLKSLEVKFRKEWIERFYQCRIYLLESRAKEFMNVAR